MSSPRRGENQPQDMQREAELMSERNGISERRNNSVNGTRKLVIGGSLIAVLGLVAGIAGAPFVYNIRGVAALEQQTISMNEKLERLLLVQERAAVNLQAVTEQVAENTVILGQGGRYTDKDASARWEAHNARHAEQWSKINERLAVLEYQANHKGNN